MRSIRPISNPNLRNLTNHEQSNRHPPPPKSIFHPQEIGPLSHFTSDDRLSHPSLIQYPRRARSVKSPMDAFETSMKTIDRSVRGRRYRVCIQYGCVRIPRKGTNTSIRSTRSRRARPSEKIQSARLIRPPARARVPPRRRRRRRRESLFDERAWTTRAPVRPTRRDRRRWRTRERRRG